jgi:heme/copper-type cytochrome/quinol oxidase subunit 1
LNRNYEHLTLSPPYLLLLASSIDAGGAGTRLIIYVTLAGNLAHVGICIDLTIFLFTLQVIINSRKCYVHYCYHYSQTSCYNLASSTTVRLIGPYCICIPLLSLPMIAAGIDIHLTDHHLNMYFSELTGGGD